MKTLMFTIAAMPMLALADTNTVSRAEFDALKREVEALREVASALHAFTDEQFVSAQNELRLALVRMKFGEMENKLKAATTEMNERMKRNSELTRSLFSRKIGKLPSRMRPPATREDFSSRNEHEVVVAREELKAIQEELAKVRAEKLERESNSTISTTNAPTLLRK